MRKLKLWLAGLVLAASIVVSACGNAETTETETTVVESTQAQTKETSTEAPEPETVEMTAESPEVSKETHESSVVTAPAAEFDLSSVPAYSGQAYVPVNNNVPFFTDTEIETESFETYSPLDGLGRCGVAYASVGQDLMPTQDRGSIGQVKPTGWHTVKYDNVDGKYLYNRCHLIGYQLTAENANEENLITGTRYLNIEGMLPFENLVADYVKETGNHVMYRVTPVFEGKNLVASGVLMEGKSVEDNGEGVLFCAYAYNVQPGIFIDYATGDSTAAGTEQSVAAEQPQTEAATQPETTVQEETPKGETYILNTSTKKFHRPSCSSVGQMKESNKEEFTGSKDDMIARGYDPCKRCNP